MLLHFKLQMTMAERFPNNEEYHLMRKLLRKQKKRQRDPDWCLPYFTNLQAETPRFQIPESNV